MAVLPEQMVVLEAVGAAGGGLMFTNTAVLGPGHPFTVVWT